MKARIKATGEIIKIADYSRITLDEHDSWGNPIEVKPEEIELIQEVPEDEHWKDVRERAAIAALQGLLSNRIYGNNVAREAAKNDTEIINEIVADSVDVADALVKRLKGE